jgi:hypothetical protein
VRVNCWFVAFAIACFPIAAAACPNAFFPPRPANAHLTRYDGVLVGYGGGTGSGFVRLRLDNGTVREFNIGANMRVDGYDPICAYPPRLGYVPSKDDCYRWPAYVFVGSTRVRVTAWPATRDGVPVFVTDRIDYIDKAMYHGRLPKD